MKDSEVISWMHHLAVSADSEVLADDIRLLADSFESYSEEGKSFAEVVESYDPSSAINDELKAYYTQDDIETVRDAYEWVANQYNTTPSSDKLSLSQFPWREDEASPAVWVSTELTSTKLPDAPDGWAWDMYDGGKQIYPNYLVKKDGRSGTSSNETHTVSNE